MLLLKSEIRTSRNRLDVTLHIFGLMHATASTAVTWLERMQWEEGELLSAMSAVMNA